MRQWLSEETQGWHQLQLCVDLRAFGTTERIRLDFTE